MAARDTLRLMRYGVLYLIITIREAGCFRFHSTPVERFQAGGTCDMLMDSAGAIISVRLF